ncbi:hypothetical protein BKA69DRAFT_820987 [Paraphysoderma sedebokerense]|nr:hypothetical protein BKA69DRAFT_820987 [Paraphysoderma sedebokerense]
MHPAEIASESSSVSLQSIIEDGKGDAEGVVMENEGKGNNEDGSRGMGSEPPSSMRNFYAIASTYLIFTLTDSALRMIVLLELFKRGFGAFELAVCFELSA